jgi:S-adenosylmethionine:tRNA ribosyltransferase-isomerase
MNDTRVLHARILFQTDTEKEIEIFCLEPLHPTNMEEALSAREHVTWKCMIGNNRAWKSGLHTMKISDESAMGVLSETVLAIQREAQEGSLWHVSFSWNGNMSFVDILEKIGHVPLPPYIERSDTVVDHEKYQTVFANTKGAVAAPTASLHVTPELLASLKNHAIATAQVTLHVGAGTFLPMSTLPEEHVMHGEWCAVSRVCIEQLFHQIEHQKPIIALGTTSLRTLESLYWLAYSLIHNEEKENNIQKDTKNKENFIIEQWMWKNSFSENMTPLESLHKILAYMRVEGKEQVRFCTHIMIVPGYDFKIVHGLITNFHQPNSTLLTLVAACIGEDWKKVYDYALSHDFRFLSYGDSSLLWCKNKI